MTTWPYDYAPSGRQKDPQCCFVGGSGTLLAEPHVEDNCCERLVDTQSCQIGVVGLSLKLSRTIGDFPKDHVQGPLEIFGGEKRYFCTTKFLYGGATAPPGTPLPPPHAEYPVLSLCNFYFYSLFLFSILAVCSYPHDFAYKWCVSLLAIVENKLN